MEAGKSSCIPYDRLRDVQLLSISNIFNDCLLPVKSGARLSASSLRTQVTARSLGSSHVKMNRVPLSIYIGVPINFKTADLFDISECTKLRIEWQRQLPPNNTREKVSDER